MTIWVVEYGAYDDNCTLGVFSSEEKANAAITHKKGDDKYYYYYATEYTLDEYHNQHCTKLSKVLE